MGDFSKQSPPQNSPTRPSVCLLASIVAQPTLVPPTLDSLFLHVNIVWGVNTLAVYRQPSAVESQGDRLSASLVVPERPVKL